MYSINVKGQFQRATAVRKKNGEIQLLDKRAAKAFDDWWCLCPFNFQWLERSRGWIGRFKVEGLALAHVGFKITMAEQRWVREYDLRQCKIYVCAGVLARDAGEIYRQYVLVTIVYHMCKTCKTCKKRCVNCERNGNVREMPVFCLVRAGRFFLWDHFVALWSQVPRVPWGFC